jgi:hypothetical protein
MAAKTPSTVVRHNAGSNNLLIATFTDIDNNDTWDTGIESIVGLWANPTDALASYLNVNESAGVVTFQSGANNRTGQLYLLVKD